MGREIKRVALDFDWPINGMIWKGYHNPYRPLECSECEGSGSSPEVNRLTNDWYSHLGSGWGKRLTQEDVQALIDADRLWDFTRVPRTEEQREIVRKKVADGENSWLPESNGYVPTADEVNEWERKSGFGHDAINCWTCVKARAKRLGYKLKCRCCDGNGHLWPSDEFESLYQDWIDVDPPAGEGWQLWTTTTEGTPMSPVLATPEELSHWLEDNRASTFGSDTATYSQWICWISKGGWAISLVADDQGIRSGVVT